MKWDALSMLSSAMMVFIFMFFLLLGGTTATVKSQGVLQEIEANIRQYVTLKTIISLMTGTAFGLVLWLFGVPLSLVFGLLAFLFNYIPNIGPIVATLVPLPFIILHPDLSPGGMLLVIVLSGSVQVLSGNMIEPKLMGDRFQIHPVAIMLTLVFWGMMWGIVGMFLATPITCAMKIIFERFEYSRPLASLLAGDLESLQRFEFGGDSA